MNMITISPEKDYMSQSVIMNLTIGEVTKRVNIELQYSEKTDRWYMTMTDTQTKEVYLMNVPVLCSYGDRANNLWEPYWYKGIGMMMCFAIIVNPSSVDPSKDNWDEFVLVWGDGVVE